ncbi:hypothetical protein IKP85_06350 [bacterium]|nr:hypothetical protein [bacterium]
MEINFSKIGTKVMALADRGSDKFYVRYNKNGIQELASGNYNLGEVLEDVYTGCSSPVLEISSKTASRHKKVVMSTKDGNEVITETPFIFSKKEDVLSLLPETKGRLKKVVLNRKEAGDIILKDDDIRMYFARPYFSAKNPVLEITSKKEDKFEIVVMELKDDKNVVARAAFSKSKDGNGKRVRKYHFFNETSVNTGNAVNGREKKNSIDLLPRKLAERINMLSDYLLMERERVMLNDKFALNGAKRKSEIQIGELMGLTKERVRQIIQNAVDKVREYNLTPEMAENYQKYSKTPKYLSKEEVRSYKNFLNDLLSQDAKRRANALSAIQDMLRIDEMRSRKKVFNIVHDIPTQAEEVIPSSPVTGVFVLAE